MARDRCTQKTSSKEDQTYVAFWQDGAKWRSAVVNTLLCLLGCSIGDFGFMAIVDLAKYNIGPIVKNASCMVAGLLSSVTLETVIHRYKEGFTWVESLQTALSMSFISMVIMELAENLTDLYLTKGTVSPWDLYYWISKAISMGVAFAVPLPYNYYKLKKHNQSCHG